jgi:hypothetical protein
MLRGNMLSGVMLNDIILIVVRLSDSVKLNTLCCYAECHYADCHFDECFGAKMPSSCTLYLI